MNADQQQDQAEIGKFDKLAYQFWDPNGDFKPLHALNPVRTAFVAGHVALPGARLLDVGCGGGLLAEALAKAGAAVTAVDLAPGMIEVARLHALESQLAIDYRCADAAQLAVSEPGSFDVLTCMEMLEHVPQPGAVIATFAALVKPGGSIFISTINRSSRAFAGAIVAAEYVLGLLPRGTHTFERFIKPSEVAAWGRHCGLILKDMAGLGYDPVTGLASLNRDTSVNYLAQLARPA